MIEGRGTYSWWCMTACMTTAVHRARRLNKNGMTGQLNVLEDNMICFQDYLNVFACVLLVGDC